MKSYKIKKQGSLKTLVWDLNSPTKEKPLLKLCYYWEILVLSITKRKARISLNPSKNASKKKRREGTENKKTNPKPTDQNNKNPISSRTWPEKDEKIKTAITLRNKTAKAL